jgi:branched-chain amino acid transport system permease protein
MGCLAKNYARKSDMRFIFKTDYQQDINLAKHRAQLLWYGVLILALVLAPLMPSVVSAYWLAQLNMILIYTVAGIGLMLLAGFTGQVSLGHAAFLGVGAYAQAWLTDKGVNFAMALMLSGLLTAAVGIVVGGPALRLKGIYLGISTIAFGFIVEEVFARWESVTNGNTGKHVKSPQLFGFEINTDESFYFACLIVTILIVLAVKNLLRSPTGRAFVAIRDSEISAQSMGIHLAYYKTLSFALSAAITGIAGALYAHKLKFISPDQFGILQSIELLLLVVVGGLGSIHGAALGAIFLISLPQVIALAKDVLPPAIGQAAGLQGLIYGLVLVLFVLFEPMGLYGRWLKIRTWFELFPFYRQGLFKRQKSFAKSDRLK